MRAAVDAGHSVGLLSSGEFRAAVAEELPPEVEFLPAGVMPEVFSAEAGRRTGADVFHPTPSTIGEIFGGSRVDLAVEESVGQATDWTPDLVVAEPFDAVGPLVAARLGVGWHRAGIGPSLPAVITDEIERVAEARYERLHLRPVAASSYIDPCPRQLQEPDWSPGIPVRAVRPQAHRRPKEVALDLADFAERDKPTVLVTLGTIFSDPDTLSAAVAAVAETGVNVIATLGSSLRHSTASRTARADLANVRYVPFVPLDQLLEKADLVVGAGGVGTVVGTLAHGLPMVLWPQGADQPINAARAAASGASITVDSAAGIAPAVAAVLGEGTYRHRAREIAAGIAELPQAATVIAEITHP
ncbi:glycosyltransferase [Streptomyces sp. L-9-10]|uniref:glycosyltransferase n=1 Tax=Streptomyces sp. L-9-10 TaxID=1478131 RepID=UPI0010D58D37|nr:nucleotide disphospho-sugar-binding domain-containing protein [Streptomyces sp. L-9-10]RYJ24894.1 glycosyltransferase [Streptomyces sp. L-9-10]